MSKFDKEWMTSAITVKIEEQRETIKALVRGVSPANGEKISENTARTQLNVQKNALKNLYMLLDILNGNWTDEDHKYFTLITTLREEKEYNRAIVHEGDSAWQLLQSNPKLNMERINKACEKAGLHINAQGIIER